MSLVGQPVNTELLVRTWIHAVDPALQVVQRLPDDLAERLPLVQVLAGGGGEDGVTATPLIDLHTFGADRAAMWATTARAHDAMRALAGADVDGWRVDSVETVSLPVALFYSPAVERAIATYRLYLTVA